MSQNKEWFLTYLSKLDQQTPQIRRIFNQLVFGMTGLCMLQASMMLPVTIYIYQSVPQILVIVDKSNQQQFYDVKSSSICTNSYKHEMVDKKLTSKSYLLLQNQRQQVVLIFPHNDDRTAFIDFIKFYSKQLRKMPPHLDAILLSLFTLIDTNRSSTLSDDEITKMLSYLKIGKRQYLMKIIKFIREEQNHEGQLSFRQFQKAMMLMECRPEIKHLYEHSTITKLKSFRSYIKPNMTKQNFAEFLRIEQGQNQLDSKKITKFVFQDKQIISFHDFCKYIFSPQNEAFCPSYEEEHVNLKLPLTSYYCMSSHNTYLTGNQLTSDSRTERYLEDLQAGYRCVEIDVHNGDKQPIVKHGFTITSAITFEEVISAIAKFSNSHLNHTPIILSLENHTSAAQQKQMASILNKHFGKKILIIKEQNTVYYPKLQQCLGKIIIKNSGTFQHFKKVSGSLTGQDYQYEEEISEDDEQDMTGTVRQSFSKAIEYSPEINQFKQLFQTEYVDNLYRRKILFVKNVCFVSSVLKNQFKVDKKQCKIVPQLINITAMLGTGSLDRPCIWQSISISEGKILKYYQSRSKVLKNHTERFWIRGYPSGGRVDSSNYNPLPAMEQGVQIIALNSQNADQYSILLRQFFRKGSRQCIGYRPKPNPQNTNLSNHFFKIRPISGLMIRQYQESEQIPILSVRMAFLGAQIDMDANCKYTQLLPYTQQIKDNAYNPVFENPKTMSLNINIIDQAFLVIHVPGCGRTVIPLQAIRKGYRCINLIDKSFCQKGSFILIKID